MGGQDDLQRAGIGSYLMAFSCERQAYSGFDSIKIDLQRRGGSSGGKRGGCRRCPYRCHAGAGKIPAAAAPETGDFYLDSQSNTLMSQGKKGFMTEVITGGAKMCLSTCRWQVFTSLRKHCWINSRTILFSPMRSGHRQKRKSRLANHPALSHRKLSKRTLHCYSVQRRLSQRQKPGCVADDSRSRQEVIQAEHGFILRLFPDYG